MTALAVNPLQRVRIVLARAHQSIGWAGLVGVALLAAAAFLISVAWSAQQAWLSIQGKKGAAVASVPTTVRAPAAPAPSSAPVDLPSASDIPLLLTQMKQAAIANGLEWRAAEYRITPSTPERPASLEVRCSVKGPYPKLRSMLVQLIGSVPAFAIREFSASRPNADIPDIEAKLVLAVFLQDRGVPSTMPSKDSP